MLYLDFTLQKYEQYSVWQNNISKYVHFLSLIYVAMMRILNYRKTARVFPYLCRMLICMMLSLD